MNREEMLLKLTGIKVCVANITYTYDLGLFFDVLRSEGVHSEQGYNISQWPCFKINVSEQTRHLIAQLRSGKEISDEDMIGYDVVRELCTFHGYGDSFLVEGETLGKCISQIREGFKRINITQDSLYVYICLETAASRVLNWPS